MMWATLTAFLPFLFQLMSFVLDRVKASNDTKAKFLALLEAVKNDGLISVEAHDAFAKQRQELLDADKKP